jgi:hypothetical protein
MEQNPPYTAPLHSTPPVSNNLFSPISKLLKTAWDKTQKHLLQLFLLSILGLVTGLIMLLLLGLLLVLAQAILSGTAMTILSSVLILAMVIVSVVLMMGINIGLMLILAETDPALSVVGVLKKALKKVLPLLIASLLGGMIILGGLVLLIIPGILFSILLSFSAYFVVLDNLSPLEAMRKSVYLFYQLLVKTPDLYRILSHRSLSRGIEWLWWNTT